MNNSSSTKITKETANSYIYELRARKGNRFLLYDKELDKEMWFSSVSSEYLTDCSSGNSEGSDIDNEELHIKEAK